MAGLKEIKRRIRSVKNTKKITYAMKLVSAAKLRRAQDAAVSSRAYADGLNSLLSELRAEQEGGDFSHPLMAVHEDVRKIKIVVAGANRGLCGGYNSNVNKKIEETRRSLEAQHPAATIEYVLLGKKPAQFFRRIRRPYEQALEELSEDAVRWPVQEIADQLTREYVEGEVDQVHLVFTRFKSAISSTPVAEQLLPLALPVGTGHEDGEALPVAGLTLFEPSVPAVFQAIVPRLVTVRLLQAALEAKASEHGSRMAAMDNATKNAGDLISSLQLTHNKLRQSGVTSDLLDIVGGAEALNG